MAVMVVTAAACGGTVTVDASTTSPTTSTSITSPATTYGPGPTSTPVESATTTTTRSYWSGETLEDGRPTTFIGVTSDYEAVEVDTETGEVLRSFGQRATPADFEGAEFPPNAVDAAWRSWSGGTILISECCEPAAGRVNALSPDQTLSEDYDQLGMMAWRILPSPTDDRLLYVGYQTGIADATDDPFSTEGSFLENDGSGVSAIGWSADGALIHWYDPASREIVSYDPNGPPEDNETRDLLPWVGANETLSGLAAQASGNLVGFLHTFGPDYDIVSTMGVVFSPWSADTFIATFPVETGSTLGGYDRSGRFLIYTDMDGIVRWQGRGLAGTLGSGFIFASW